MVLQLDNVSMVYPNGTRALNEVSVAFRPGRIHGLAGANGAGKSTLLRILSGDIAPTAGQILWRGQPTRWPNPRAAAAEGIAAMPQHVPLFGQLSVLENVYMARSPFLRRSKRTYADYAQLCEVTGIWADPNVLVDELSIGERQVIGLLQVLSTDPDLLVLDEPTASLGYSEREALFSAVRRVRTEGRTILYISHFLDELLDLTDDITVLRDGSVVGASATADLTVDRLAELIIGRRLAGARATAPAFSRSPNDARTVLEVRNLSVANLVHDVSFSVRQGEVVGIAGLLGSGRSELLHAIIGATRRSGEVRVDGQRLGRSIVASIRAGVGFVPEDRQSQGLLMDWSIARNVCLPWLRHTSKWRVLTDEAREQQEGEQAITRLSIRAPGATSSIRSLSGGNAQKVLFGRWLPWPSKVLVLDEPMRGIDVGAKQAIAQVIREWAASGMACVVVDSEFEALLQYADRILVLSNGRIVWSGRADAISEHQLLLAANGMREEIPA
jgi:ribose transport system ATP-binding protein